jgi:hypothetical protein
MPYASTPFEWKPPIGWFVQLPELKRSAKTPGNPSLSPLPNATHVVVSAHETAVSAFDSLSGRFGVDWTLQVGSAAADPTAQRDKMTIAAMTRVSNSPLLGLAPPTNARPGGAQSYRALYCRG